DVPSGLTIVVLDDHRAELARRNRRRLVGVGCRSVAGVGYGVYSSVWNGEGLGIVASGGPRVIAADKEPVKVVPENPGGKTVP
ncbi:hypothetical protein ACC699_39275, partial [Rhizobium ruizarguesonis]